jgi:uncharacterized protein
LNTAAPLEAKVAALRDPRSYPETETRVVAVETHMSWIFLTSTHAWKLKKPVCLEEQDFRTLDARRFYCEEELRLNRRLAPEIYLSVVPLRAGLQGRLRVAGEGEVVDWLVQMRRLPAASMLDALLASRTATASQMRAVAARLCAFYREQPPAPIHAPALRTLLLGHVQAAERDLCRHEVGLPPEAVRALCASLREYLRSSTALFESRIRQGRVVEGHGDLRPEHVYLGEPLAIIDCLEFSPRLRMQDAADEVGFLALECERAGAAPLAQVLLDAYRQGSGDDVPGSLVHFYQSCRACVRGRLAVRHLLEPGADTAKWGHRAREYLALAIRHMRAAGFRPSTDPSASRPRASA